MTLTIVFFVFYILIVVIIGLVSAHKESEDDFMIAKRNVAGIQAGATMSAGFFDGAVLAIYLAYIYQYGISALWLFIGLAGGFLLLRWKYATIIKRKADETNAYTMSEYFYHLFGKRVGLMFSFILILQYIFLLMANLVVAGKVFSSIFDLPYALSLLVGGGIVLTYLLLAGFKAVIKTDFFQLVIMLVMSITVAMVLFGKTSIPMSEFDPIGIGWGNVFGFLFLGSIGLMVAPDLWQRIFATKDTRALKKGLGFSAFMLPVLACIISIVGLTTKQFFPDILPEDALIVGFSHLLPFGLKEFGMVLLYAVALSSSDTIVFVIASIITRDLKNYTTMFSEKSMKRMMRLGMFVLVGIVLGIGIVYQNIIALGLSLGSIAFALFPIIVGSFYRKLPPKAVFWSLVGAIVSVVVLLLMDMLTPDTTLIVLPVSLVTLILFSYLFRS